MKMLPILGHGGFTMFCVFGYKLLHYLLSQTQLEMYVSKIGTVATDGLVLKQAWSETKRQFKTEPIDDDSWESKPCPL